MEVHNQHPSHDTKQAEVVVIMVPFPCQSHLNQVLHLSCLISSYNIPVHYACSATHVHQAKLRFNGINSHAFAQIHFHEFPTPHFVSPPPDPNALSKFPSHLQPSFEASLHLRHPMTKLLHKISSTTRRVIVVHDALMAYVVQDIATTPNAESYSFNATSQHQHKNTRNTEAPTQNLLNTSRLPNQQPPYKLEQQLKYVDRQGACTSLSNNARPELHQQTDAFAAQMQSMLCCSDAE
ncbi:hypothetical protein TEA_008648 [Camellia sinensis var. sinensis]|uniref:Glycosyltransferase N-terminal domain-containing protein n=1 Tax=Camellia sinensis var. sinensis TaxID=542762 RepID=A0A4S4F4Y7_CAMSN|nr:hypothetical protein TEA_008648 [Camellia sinensis var. sinensis]